MNNYCKYCAQSNTKKDELGYCIKYNCIERAGKHIIINNLLHELFKMYDIPKYTSCQIGVVISNPYNKRHRFVSSIINKCKIEFNCIPSKIRLHIPDEYLKTKWDKNIRW